MDFMLSNCMGAKRIAGDELNSVDIIDTRTPRYEHSWEYAEITRKEIVSLIDINEVIQRSRGRVFIDVTDHFPTDQEQNVSQPP
jgi:hypothetical protein